MQEKKKVKKNLQILKDTKGKSKIALSSPAIIINIIIFPELLDKNLEEEKCNINLIVTLGPELKKPGEEKKTFGCPLRILF